MLGHEATNTKVIDDHDFGGRSWRSAATVLRRRPSVRSFVTSKRSCATWRSTSSRRWPPLPAVLHWRRATNYPTSM